MGTPEKWIKETYRPFGKIDFDRSGGNINKLFKMSGKAPGTPLSYVHLKALYKLLKSMNYKQRIKELGLNPDRADVIVPAGKIYTRAMKWTREENLRAQHRHLRTALVKYLPTKTGKKMIELSIS